MSLEQKIYNLPEWLKSEMRNYIMENAKISTTKYYTIIKKHIIKDLDFLSFLRDFLKIYNCHLDMERLMRESFHLFLINQTHIQKL